MHSKISSQEKLADSVIALLKHDKLDKISVSQITANCHMTRQVFYHYFTDKYDLILWICKRDYNQLLIPEDGTFLYKKQFYNLIVLMVRITRFELARYCYH